MSQLNYYAAQLQFRREENDRYNQLLRAGKLLHQYAVDSYVKVCHEPEI